MNHLFTGLERRFGRFEFSIDVFGLHLELLQLIMSCCIPVEIIPRISSGILEYIAYSNQFDVLEEGEVIPYYNIVFTCKVEEGRKHYSFIFKREV